MADEYVNGVRVRILPMGVHGRPEEKFAKSSWGTFSTWGTCPEGYESTADAGQRLKISRWAVRKLCAAGRLEHVRRGIGKKTRLFVKKGAKPVETG